MATRFMRESDYDGRIKAEIKQTLTGSTSDPEATLLRAEEGAIATIAQYIGAVYDCTVIFQVPQPNGTGDPDPRNQHIVKCVIALALYDLYGQTGVKDVPLHRQTKYEDTIQWLKDMGRGAIKSLLPKLPDEVDKGEVRYNSRPPRNNKW